MEERKDEERQRWKVGIRERKEVAVDSVEGETDERKLKCSVSSPLHENM